MILKRIPTTRSKVKRAASMLGLIVLMVLTLTGSASAECGWVLWQHTTPVQAAVAQGDNHPSLDGLGVRMATGVNVTYRCRPNPCTQRAGPRPRSSAV